MRILGYIEHPVVKITVFEMNNRFSVKFESGLLEQSYKFRKNSELNSFEDVAELVDEGFISGVLAEFSSMHLLKSRALNRWIQEEEKEDFDDII